MKKLPTLPKPERAILAAGLGTLILAFAVWVWQQADSLTLPVLLAAGGSAALFAIVGVQAVPQWGRAWRERAVPSEPEKAPRGFLWRLFILLLLFCVAVWGLVYLIRRWEGNTQSFLDSFSFWTSLDSRHYLDIARDGYIAQGDYDRMVQLVFFPGYPVAVRLLSFLLGGQLLLSSFVVSAVSFAGAGCLFYRLMRLDASHEEAVRAVVFLCLLPGVFFFAAPMSESFFLLLAVGSCYAARTGRWLLAGLLGGAAALTRSVGVLLLVPLFFEWMALPRRRGRALGSLLLVPAGFLGYLLLNFLVTGDAFTFLTYQRAHWYQEPGWFFATAGTQMQQLLSVDRVADALGLWLPNLLSGGAALFVLALTARRQRASDTAWFLCYYIVAMGATWLLSGPRYLLVLWPIHRGLAILTGTKKRRAAVYGLCAVCALFYLYAFCNQWQVW